MGNSSAKKDAAAAGSSNDKKEEIEGNNEVNLVVSEMGKQTNSFYYELNLSEEVKWASQRNTRIFYNHHRLSFLLNFMFPCLISFGSNSYNC